MQIITCIGITAILLALFEIFGTVVATIWKLNSGILKNVVIGCFAYYALFQFLALPMVLLKQPLSLLSRVWFIFLILMLLAFIFCCFWKNRKGSRWKPEFKGKPYGYILLAIVMVIFLCRFVLMQNYWGWDTTFYVGTINTSLYTDTMYVFDGNSGLPCREIDFRYALSMFYMNSAVFCKWFGVSALFMQKCVINVLCVLLHSMILYLMGQEMFSGKMKKSLLFMVVALGLNFFFISEYTTSQFLLMRSYEAKAYCANVVITGLLWQFLCMWNRREDTWKCMFLVMLASVPLSMSSILILPVMLCVGVLTELIVQKKIKILLYGILCAIPNLIYLVVYFLYTKDILSIRV